MSTTPTMHHTRELAHGEWGERIIHAGVAAKGIVYALTALLAYRLATGTPPEQEAAPSGAVRYLAEQPFGTALLLVLAVGLVAYSLGRVLRATVLATADDGAAKRLGFGVTAAVYLGLAVLAAGTALGRGGAGGGGSGSDQRPQEAASTAFSLPFGRWLVGGVGVALLVYAAYEVRRALTRGFRSELDAGVGGDGIRQSAEPLGVVGLLGHGAALGLIGFFLVRAAVTYDPSEAEGLDGALHRLATGPWGTTAILAVAAGLLAYAGWCALLARYQRVP